jgi:hypothetical protein
MRWTRRAPILILCAVSLALPGQAAAASIAPPGKAGADQYFETLPSSGGNVAPPNGGGGGSGHRALTQLGQGAAGASRLAHLGADGAAAAALAAATAPTPAAHRGHRAALPIPAPAAADSTSTAGAIAHVLTGSDSGGLGVVLPLLLATGVIAALGLAAARLRRGSDPPELSA